MQVQEPGQAQFRLQGNRRLYNPCAIRLGLEFSGNSSAVIVVVLGIGTWRREGVAIEDQKGDGGSSWVGGCYWGPA
jgi:hypothetical protein